jgi:Ca2+-dependent lipid-binding protein
MSLNKALFSDNGNCGYVLKPEILRNPKLKFNPDDIDSMRNKKKLQIRIISAHQLPQNDELILNDISDPFVTINIFGVKADWSERKTKSVKDNGFNPFWNENFKFTINCPELCFIKFTVKDEDIAKDQLIGEYTIKFENMSQGYRHIKLNNKTSTGILFVGIKIKSFK